MHTPDVLKFKKMLTVLYLSCPFKRDFTAVSSLGNSGDILILPVYYCYSCNWCGICAGSRRRSTCENCHYVFMSIKYLNFCYTVETIVVIYSSAQQCSWFFFQHFIESWWKTREIKYITNYVSNFSVCWETALAFSLINVSWKSPVWMVCLVKNCCGTIHTSVLYYTFKKKKKENLPGLKLIIFYMHFTIGGTDSATLAHVTSKALFSWVREFCLWHLHRHVLWK